MAMPKEEIEALVKEVVEKQVSAAVLEFVRKNEDRAKELALIERVVRVEEELKALREIESARFEAIQERFEALQKVMDERFQAMGERLEALQREMDKRFEAVQARFEAVDARFEALQREMDKRFEALQSEMSVRFMAVEKRLTQVQWFIGIWLGAATLFVGLLKVLG
jgi:DNA anti-recombination protein RmuC